MLSQNSLEMSFSTPSFPSSIYLYPPPICASPLDTVPFQTSPPAPLSHAGGISGACVLILCETTDAFRHAARSHIVADDVVIDIGCSYGAATAIMSRSPPPTHTALSTFTSLQGQILSFCLRGGCVAGLCGLRYATPPPPAVSRARCHAQPAGSKP
jgi:hypothetical protein